MKKVIIFGINDFAELAHYYLCHDSDYEVVAFCLNKEYINERKIFKDLPIIPFEEVDSIYSPKEYLFFAPMAPNQMNKIREKIYLEAKAKGYKFISYISSKATILSDKIGENCFILEDNTIQPFTSIGDNVILWSGNHIGHHSIIESHVMFTSHVVLSGHCHVKKYSTLGVNATIRDGITIEEGTFVAMGASIIKNTESWMIYMGNPGVPTKKSL